MTAPIPTHKLVPIEPTEAMVEETSRLGAFWTAASVYRIMIAAAPAIPEAPAAESFYVRFGKEWALSEPAEQKRIADFIAGWYEDDTEAPADDAAEWTITGPDGSRFTGPTPLKVAVEANRHRVQVDPVAAANFKAVIERAQQENEAENARLLAEHGTLNCPTCGGSGHIGDVSDDPAERVRLVEEAKALTRRYAYEQRTAENALDSQLSSITLDKLHAAIDAIAALPTPPAQAAATEEPITLSVKRNEWETLSPEAQAKLLSITGAASREIALSQARAAEKIRAAPLMANAPAEPTVPWPTVTRYTGGADSAGACGRVWLKLGDGPEEVEYVPASAQGLAGVWEVDADGEPYTPERLAEWLDTMHRRLKEPEDKAAANMIRALAAQAASTRAGEKS